MFQVTPLPILKAWLVSVPSSTALHDVFSDMLVPLTVRAPFTVGLTLASAKIQPPMLPYVVVVWATERAATLTLFVPKTLMKNVPKERVMTASTAVFLPANEPEVGGLLTL